MLKKIAASVTTLVFATGLASCSSSGDNLDEVDVNGMVISDACEAVREGGWRVAEVRGEHNAEEMSDCSDGERKVIRAYYWTHDKTVDLHFPNEEAVTGEPTEEEAPAEEPPVEEAPVEPASNDGPSGYQAIYDEYSVRIQNECPTLSISECTELSHEGVSKMAEYMYKASGTDGQYETYQTWAGKLYDVYMASFR